MNTKIETKEQDLFKITTIKKKHAEQVRVTHIGQQADFSNHDVLGYITEWNAVLVKDRAIGHYATYNASVYADWLIKAEGIKSDEAYKKAIQLPQLFLD